MNWVVIAIIILIFVFSQKSKEKKAEEKQEGDKKEDTELTNLDKLLGSLESRGAEVSSETYKIYEEVEKRRLRAEELKIDELITGLYFDEIEYYPHRIKSPTAVCSLITNAVESIEKNEEEETITKTKITLKDKEYTFSFSENAFSVEGDYFHHGNLELFADGKKILALSLSCDYNKYGSEWRTFKIDAFIEGEWIEDFRQLEKQIEAEEKERKRKEKEDPEKLRRLKDDFGIE